MMAQMDYSSQLLQWCPRVVLIMKDEFGSPARTLLDDGAGADLR